MNLNIFRLRCCQLLLKLRFFLHQFRILLHHADIALYNFRVLRLKRRCQRMNLPEHVNIPPFFHSALKLSGEVNNVFDSSHNVVMPRQYGSS